jgi:hypothetical protein
MFERIFARGYQSVCGLVAGIAAILAPCVPLIITAFVFIFLDLFYGYKVCRKYKSKHFESSKFWKTVEKLGLTAVLVASFTLLDKFIFMTYDDLVFAKVAAGTVCFAEIISLLESLRALKPNSITARLLSSVIKSKANKYLDVDITDIIDDIPNDNNTITNNKESNKV